MQTESMVRRHGAREGINMDWDAAQADAGQRRLSIIFRGVEFYVIHRGRKLRCLASLELLARAYGAKNACRQSWLEAFDRGQPALHQCARMKHLLSGRSPVLLLDDEEQLLALRSIHKAAETSAVDSPG
jgi:hypothetical protein